MKGRGNMNKVLLLAIIIAAFVLLSCIPDGVQEANEAAGKRNEKQVCLQSHGNDCNK